MNSKVSRAGNAIRLSRGTRSKVRSEEHTSELQSLTNLVCRLLLEKRRAHSELQSLTNLVCRLVLEKKRGDGSSAAALRSRMPLAEWSLEYEQCTGEAERGDCGVDS